MKTGSIAEPILVGRNRELNELKSGLQSAFEGHGNTIFISGEAGSGKTRLANEFIKTARRKGTIVLSGWCLSNAVVPYFPFLEALESFSAEDDCLKAFGPQQLRMKTWLTEPNWAGGPEKQYMSPQTWRDQAFAAVKRELLLMSSSKPTILFIDDIHWADSASLSLLHYIARAITSERILLLATFRREEVASSIDAQSRPLLESLRIMGREGILKEIKLQSLTHVDVERIAESMLGGSIDAELVKRLATESRGVPLFVVESLRMLHEQGRILQQQGQWTTNVKEYGVPDKVKDVILRRLDSLRPNQRRILDAASAIGEKFDPKLVATVVNQDTLDVLESLNAIAESTLLVGCAGDYYSFVHAKFREMLYSQISTPLRKEYHSRIAENLENLRKSSKKIQIGEIAYHYIQAGNKEKSTQYALEAGKDALARFSNKEALRHFNYVLQSVEEDPEYANDKSAALEGLGEALFANSMFREATRSFEQLAGITTGVVKLHALRRAMDSAFFQGEFVHLLELTKKAEEFSVPDRLERARVLMNRARAVMFLGDYEAGRADFEAALKVFEEELSLSDVARNSLGLGGVHREEQQEEGLARALRAVTLYEELDDDRGLMDACNRAGQSFGYRMLTTEALAMREKAVGIGEKIGDFNRMAEAEVSSAWCLEAVSDFSGALSGSLKALGHCEKTDSDWTRGMTYSNLARLYARLGDLANAEQYFQKLVRLPQGVLSVFAFVKFGLSRAVFLAARQQLNEANQYFEECLKAARVGVPPSLEIVTRNYYAWILDKQNKPEEAKNQLKMAGKTIERFENYFRHAAIHAMLMAPRAAFMEKEFAFRLDIVNVSKKPCEITAIEGIVPCEFRILEASNGHSLINDSIIVKEGNIEPFQVKPIKLTLQATTSGVFNLKPQVVYLDDFGIKKTCKINPVSITIQPAAPKLEERRVVTSLQKFEPKSEAASKALDYLVSAILEDLRQLKMPPERAGWRTLMDVVKEGKVSKYSVYGTAGRRGKALLELERLGLVETRVFEGERGRGGNILKIRADRQNASAKGLSELREE